MPPNPPLPPCLSCSLCVPSSPSFPLALLTVFMGNAVVGTFCREAAIFPASSTSVEYPVLPPPTGHQDPIARLTLMLYPSTRHNWPMWLVDDCALRVRLPRCLYLWRRLRTLRVSGSVVTLLHCRRALLPFPCTMGCLCRSLVEMHGVGVSLIPLAC